MRKRVFGYQLNRDTNERKALFRSLVSNLFDKGEIETTLIKAKAIQGEAERLITKAKKGAVSDRRTVQQFLTKRDLVNKLFDQIAPVFKDKKGGYTRIVRTGFRYGDGAPLVKIALTEEIPLMPEIVKEKKEIPEKEKKVVSEVKKPVKKKVLVKKELKPEK